MADDRTSIEQFLGQVVDAWKTNDGDAVANCFTEEGVLVNPFGQRADGRAAVAAMYRDYFDGMLRGTTTTLELDSIRLVETEHAFVDTEQTIRGADGEVALVVHLAALLRLQGSAWRFIDARPYTVPEPPG